REKFKNLLYKNKVAPNEFRIKTKSGKLVWIRTSANIIFENGEAAGIRGLAVDISAQKETELELIKAKEKAEESDRLKSAFLASMSHELRTPLNAVIGFSGLIIEETDIQQITEMGKHINESGNHLLNIIEDIFEISMLQTKKHKVINEEFSISDLLDSLKRYTIFEIEKTNKTNLNLEFLNPSPSTLLYTDKTKLNQVLINLVKNSIKFTIKGKISLSYKITDGDIEFCVNDTGIGIPEDKINIIFEQFRQVDDSLTREHGGVGLGLAICKEISKILDGNLWVESKEKEGTSFYFLLKNVVVESEIHFEKNENTTKIDFSDKTILVVEDVESNYILLKNYIAILKASVLWVKNGEESVKICNERDDIDLVLMDIRMPGMDGFEATRQIIKSKPDLKIIAQTAYALKNDEKMAMDAGCIDYIAKPIRIADFNRLIKKHLS
ncbi:MAG: response regulator, partial [Prolixibacteraceae bacterium]|nr:response regulator [Prolixibacteraceae bacterium]